MSDIHWKKVGKFPHHGICLPLFSLHTQKNFPRGEFFDLIPLINWCKELHFDCIQLLPLQDSGSDPSPYSPLSSLALDPIYLNLSELGIHTSASIPQKSSKEELLSLKIELLKKHFKSLSSLSFLDLFIKENEWVLSYARFKALKEQCLQVPFEHFPSQIQADEHLVSFYIWVQFHCFRQMHQVFQHASAQKVFLLGDLPILVSPESADVWAHPSFFNRDIQAGAPPDLYNAEGQKWGFPLLRWEKALPWWKTRLKVAERFYHLYRIDHIVGFFRIWGIEKDKIAKEGRFFPDQPSLWPLLGRQRLEMMLKLSPLLPIGEDLGTIPKEVYPILKELGICGMKVIRWQKTKEGNYLPFDRYEPLSMTTVSTHDLEPLELWWRKFPEESAPFAKWLHLPYHPILSAKEREKILYEAHRTSSLFHINLLQEYLSLFAELSHLDPEEERINIPGVFLPKNWTYSFYPSLEEIISSLPLKQALQRIIPQTI